MVVEYWNAGCIGVWPELAAFLPTPAEDGCEGLTPKRPPVRIKIPLPFHCREGNALPRISWGRRLVERGQIIGGRQMSLEVPVPGRVGHWTGIHRGLGIHRET